ncbi:MAG: type II toxin-antitoxin system RelE/ParE family toxin [Oscillospiraceae bacterium]|nr:type II toxin-antitoxin system RelE/ParE family toxin [Oscillospiraceae bacterium]
MGFKIIRTEDFKKDLFGVLDYLNNFSDQTSLKYYNLVQQKIRKLRRPPFGAGYVSNDRLRKLGYRWLYIKNYILFFTVDEEEKTVYIQRIIHSKRAYECIL